MNKSQKILLMVTVAVIFFILSGVCYAKGYDKITNYYNSDYPSLNVNAYVGGDAYNYIINGNYATGFYVLSIGFLIAGVILVCASILLKAIPEEINISLNNPVTMPVSPATEPTDQPSADQ